MCHKKQSFASAAEAKKALRTYRGLRQRTGLAAYFCAEHHAFHLGHHQRPVG